MACCILLCWESRFRKERVECIPRARQISYTAQNANTVPLKLHARYAERGICRKLDCDFRQATNGNNRSVRYSEKMLENCQRLRK